MGFKPNATTGLNVNTIILMSQKNWNSYRKQIGFLSLPQWPVWMQMPIRLDPYQAWISSPCNIILFSNVYLYCLTFVILFVYLYCQNCISFTFVILSFLLCCCQNLLSRMKLCWEKLFFPKELFFFDCVDICPSVQGYLLDGLSFGFGQRT